MRHSLSEVRKGLTQIELMVVLSITVLFFLVSFPMLDNAGGKARKGLCKKNLRYQMNGFIAYAADHDQQYPPSAKGESAWWPFLLGTWHGDNPHIREAWYPAAQGALYAYGYLEDPNIFFCPAASVKKKDDYVYGGQASEPVNFQYHWVRRFHPDDPNWNWGYGLGDPKWGPWCSYSYWVGYKLPDRMYIYKKRIEAGAANDPFDRADKIITNDMTVTAPLRYSPNQTYQGLEDYPIWSNHVVKGKLTGGNLLYNDGSVGWSNFRDMASEPDPHLRVAYFDTSIRPYNGSCWWF